MTQRDDLFSAVRSRNLDLARKILTETPNLVHERDTEGATPLHYAAELGDRTMVQFLISAGASVNARDGRFQATPTGWAIEYLRQLGGLLGVEISDAIYAIRNGDVAWLKRLLDRFPWLTQADDGHGVPIAQYARESGDVEIVKLFETMSKRA